MKIRLFKTDVIFTLSSLLLFIILFNWGFWSTENLVSALAIMVLGFASLLTHEFMHVFAARKFSIGCKKIIVMFIGMGAELRNTGTKPRETFVISAAGPLTSFVLGTAFLLLANVAATDVFNAVGLINIVLGMFNTLPLFPLDGGRMAHSILWKITRDEQKGRIFAVRVSKVCIVGLWGLVAWDFTQGYSSMLSFVWTSIIAYFLWTSANAELKYHTSKP